LSTWRSGDEVALEVGRLCALCRELHVLLGEGAQAGSVAGLVVSLDEWSLQLAEHAASLYELLPLRAGFDRDVALDPGVFHPALAQLRSWSAAGDDVALLAGFVDEVLPALRREVATLREGCSEAAERSLRRALGFLTLDLDEAARIGGARLAQLGQGPEILDCMERARAALEAILPS
jgi:hypothetical protein